MPDMTPEEFKQKYPWANTDYRFDQQNGRAPGTGLPNSSTRRIGSGTTSRLDDPTGNGGFDPETGMPLGVGGETRDPNSSDQSGSDLFSGEGVVQWVKDAAGNLVKRVVGGGGDDKGSGGKSSGDRVMDGVRWAGDHAIDVGLLGLTGLQIKNAADASRRAGQYSDQAIDLAKQNWKDGEGLRNTGRAGLMAHRTRPDLNAVFADPTNPFASSRRPIQGAPTDGVPPGAGAEPTDTKPSTPVDNSANTFHDDGALIDPRYGHAPNGIGSTAANTLGLPMDKSGKHPQGFIGGTGSGPGEDAWKYDTYIDPKIGQPAVAPVVSARQVAGSAAGLGYTEGENIAAGRTANNLREWKPGEAWGGGTPTYNTPPTDLSLAAQRRPIRVAPPVDSPDNPPSGAIDGNGVFVPRRRVLAS